MEIPLIGIVDDDEAVRESIGSLVRSAGFRAALFPSAEAFLTSDHLNETECLILDVRMPRVSGPELQNRLAEMRRAIPIIFATAYTDPGLKRKALDRGAVAFLPKPFGEEELFTAMRAALRH